MCKRNELCLSRGKGIAVSQGSCARPVLLQENWGSVSQGPTRPSPAANPALTFYLDHSVGADQDCDTCDSQRFEIVGILHNAIDGGLHIGAVIADEHNERGMLASEIIERVGLSIRGWKPETRGLVAKLAFRWGLYSHRQSSIQEVGLSDIEVLLFTISSRV